MKIKLPVLNKFGDSRFLLLMVLSGLGFFFLSSMINDVKATDDNSTSMVLNIQHTIPLKVALVLAMSTQDACTDKGFAVTVSVLNRDGLDILLARGDGTTGASVDVARDKAYAAVGFQSPTSGLEERAKTSNPGIIAVEGFTVLPGGLPIRAGDEVIGGIGVSGAPSGKIDEECATAGLSAITSILSGVDASNVSNQTNNISVTDPSSNLVSNATSNNLTSMESSP
ncbi:MAG: heme-binding protein [Candidatus Nitrosocosmicus sp.]|nr:heme-binding protein [Candidatus Nitrosocosmicus sp.]